MERHFDVTGIGNAIIDVLAKHDDTFLAEFSLTKGSMELIDQQRCFALYDALGSTTLQAGGSVANTIAGVASLGGAAAFVGKVGDDLLGERYRAQMTDMGIDFSVPATPHEPTGRSMIVVTPDAERTMSTFLGAATTLYPDDIDTTLMRNTSVLYCEGYIWDVPVTKSAIRTAIAAVKQAGHKVSFTLSDPFCVDRHHDEWLELVDGPIDILFGNVAEMEALTGLSDLDQLVDWIRGRVEIACITRSELGSVIVTDDEVITVDAVSVPMVVDTTGAGDLYAAGVLYGLSVGADAATCGALGSLCASEVIAHVGARPATSLRQLAQDVGMVPPEISTR